MIIKLNKKKTPLYFEKEKREKRSRRRKKSIRAQSLLLHVHAWNQKDAHGEMLLPTS
jgi:hypothetical protein